jgi:hypothetical protein
VDEKPKFLIFYLSQHSLPSPPPSLIYNKNKQSHCVGPLRWFCCFIIVIVIGNFSFLQFPLNKLSDQLREQIAQAGFTEALTFALVCTLYSNFLHIACNL